MSLEEDIQKALVSAMKRKDELRVNVIRLIRSACKNKQIDKRNVLTDADIVAILQKLSNQAKDSIDQFDQAGRTDLADKERKELSVLREFLPKALDEKEIAELIDQAIKACSASSMKDMGQVMKYCKENAEGLVDGKLLSEMVKKKLSA